jgi:hypothetical protein
MRRAGAPATTQTQTMKRLVARNLERDFVVRGELAFDRGILGFPQSFIEIDIV